MVTNLRIIIGYGVDNVYKDGAIIYTMKKVELLIPRTKKLMFFS